MGKKENKSTGTCKTLIKYVGVRWVGWWGGGEGGRRGIFDACYRQDVGGCRNLDKIKCLLPHVYSKSVNLPQVNSGL